MSRRRRRKSKARRKGRRRGRRKGKVNPRTGRRTVYLGHRVKDTGKPGLDNLSEVRRISQAILRDYKAGRIDKKTASGRFARLHNTIIPRDPDLKGKRRKAKKIVKQYWEKL